MAHNQKAASNSGDVCPVCGGTGIEQYEEIVEGYSAPLKYGRECPRCRGKNRQEDRTGVPPQFYEADLQKFPFDSYKVNLDKLQQVVRSFVDNYGKWKEAGKGLYLWSKTPGSGKTFLSCCVAKSAMMKNNLKMRFITTPDYLAKVGDSYKRQQGSLDESQIYRDCALLVLDDLGTQKNGDWQEQELFRLINERLNTGCITIFTANMAPEELKIDNRTIDRIRKSSIVLQMPEESIRLKKAQEEQERFLENIFQGGWKT